MASDKESFYSRSFFIRHDPAALARACGVELVEQRPFFTRARALLGRRLGLRTRIAMAVADRLRRTMIVHLAFGPGAPEGRRLP